MIAALARFVLGLSLLVLPGAWLAFGLPLRRLSFPGRLAVSGVLSPVVVAAEFYLLRLEGVSFAETAWSLALLNAGSIWLLIRGWQRLQARLSSFVLFAAAYLILAGCVSVPWLFSKDIRMFTGHPLMHAGILYQFPGGALVPEEPELAGVRLIYPWLGHVYWAVVGWVTNLPPTWLYILTNLVWLFWICILFYEICRVLGASPFSSRIALLWLGLGTNVLGSLIWSAKLSFFGQWMRFPGDVRFSPFVRQFIVFEVMPFALGLFAALILVSLWALRERQRPWLVATAVLLGGIGLIYPVLIPAALSFCGVLLLLFWWHGRSQQLPNGDRSSILLFAMIGGAAALALGNAHLLLQGRSTAAVTLTAGLRPFLGKLLGAILALGPFLLAGWTLARRRLPGPEIALLLIGSLPSVLLWLVFQVSAGHNEYKFIFCAALGLAPLLALAVDRWVPQKVSPTFVLLVTLLLIVPALPTLYVQQGMYGFPFFPQVKEEGFFFRLGPSQPEAEWTDAIRARTPPNTVIVLSTSEIFVPGLVGRSVWAPPEQPWPLAGYWAESRFTLLHERGYPATLLDAREAVLHSLYQCGGTCNPAAILAQLKALKRPLAIVFPPREGQDFLAWLADERQGRLLYRDARGTIVWLLPTESHVSVTGCLEEPEQPGAEFARRDTLGWDRT